jgi:hypothetical protein
MPVNPDQLSGYIALFQAALPLGIQMVQGIRALLADHGLTNEEINALEQQAVTEAEALKAKRERQGQS